MPQDGGSAYDGTSSEAPADFAAVDNSTILPDGEYAPSGFSFACGADDVNVACEKVVVIGGKAYGTLRVTAGSGSSTHVYLAYAAGADDDGTLVDEATGVAAAGVYAVSEAGEAVVPVDLNLPMPLSVRVESDEGVASWVPDGVYELSLEEIGTPAALEWTVEDGHATVSGVANPADARVADVPATAKVDGVEYPVASVGEGAFDGCAGLVSASVADGVTSIGASAFSGCSQLSSVSLPASLVTIGDAAFEGCTSLQSIELPQSLSSLGNRVFAGCTSLTSTSVPGTASVGESAFEGCTALASVTLSEGVTTIPRRAFAGCESLAEVFVPRSVTLVGEEAFDGCVGLSSLLLPRGVTSLGARALSGCSGLSSLSLPATLRDIADDALDGVSGTVTVPDASRALRYCEAHGLVCQITYEDVFVTFSISDGKATVTGLTADGEVERHLELPSTVTKDGIVYPVVAIGANALVDCPNLEELVIPEGVESIGKRGVYFNQSLRKLTLPSSLRTIGEEAFAINQMLEGPLIIPEGVESFGYRALVMCNKLKVSGVVLPASLKSIGNGSFGKTDRLSVPAGSYAEQWVKENDRINYEVRPLATFSVSDGKAEVTGLSDDGKVVSSVEIPATCSQDGVDYPVTSIAQDALSGYENLEEVVVPEGVEVLRAGSLAKNPNLKSVKLPSTLKTVEADALANNPSLASVEMSEGVAEIGSCAFGSDPALQGLSLPASLTSIADDALDGTSTAGLMVKPESYAKQWCESRGISSATTPLQVTTSELPETVPGDEYSAKVEATYPDAVFSAEGLPEGLSMAADGTVSGSPVDASNATVTVTAASRGLTTTATIPLVVAKSTLTFTVENGQATVTGVRSRSAKRVIVPATYQGVPVTAIGSSVFSSYSNLTSIKLPSTLKTIGSAAFSNSGLTEIDIPEGVTEIPATCFWKCGSLKRVGLPSTLTTIARSAFGSCDELEAIDIPEGVTSIGDSAFFQCGKLKRCALPSTLKSIDKWAFQNEFDLLEVTVPASVTMFGDQVFDRRWVTLTVDLGSAAEAYAKEYQYKYVVRPESVTVADLTYESSGGKATVTGATNLATVNRVEVPATWETDDGSVPVTAMGEGALRDSGIVEVQVADSVSALGPWCLTNTRIRQLTLPGSITNLGEGCLSGNAELTSVTLSEGTASIGPRAFANDAVLSSITVPASVTDIADDAFEGCKTLTIYGAAGSAAESYAAAHDIPFKVADETYPAFSFAVDTDGNATVTGVANGDEVTVLDFPSVYQGHPVTAISSTYGSKGWPSKARRVTIPDSVTSISGGLDMLYYVETITIPSSVTSIDGVTFVNDLALKHVALPDGCLRTVKANMFSACQNLEELTLPEGTKTIRDNGFSGAPKLKSLTIPDSVTTIEEKAFSGCDGLVITCNHGSTAATFAKAHGISVHYADATPVTDVQDLIEDLPDVADVKLSDMAAIKAVRAAYDALADDQRAQVNNLERLTAAEGALAPYLADVTVTTEELPPAVEGTAYSTALGFSGPTFVTWKLASGDLPAGLALDEETGAITGTPEAPCSVTFEVAAIGPGGQEGTRELTLEVRAADQAAAEEVGALVAALPDPDEVDAGDADAIAAARAAYDALTDGQRALVPMSGKLPAVESALAALSADVDIETTELPAATVGQQWSALLTASGPSRVTWSVVAGELPQGVTLDAATGTLSGTPTVAGDCHVTVRATGPAGQSADCEVVLRVESEPAAASRVERLAGTAESGAAGTAAAIAAEAFAGSTADTVVIARNDDYHDALAGSGLAGALNAPILLTDKGSLSQAAADEIGALGATKAVILGGTSAVSDQVEADLGAMGLQVDRLGGADVYGTSMAINERLVSMAGADRENAVVVNPTTFADALSISGWAYANRVPVMLQTWGDTAAERGFDDEAKAILAGRHLIVCGGEGAVSSASVSAIDPGFERLGGDTVYDTSLAIAGWELGHGMSASDVTVASAIPDYNGVDALAASALAGRKGGVTLLAQSNGGFGWYDDGATAVGFVRAHASDIERVHVLGGEVASTPALYDAIKAALGEE